MCRGLGSSGFFGEIHSHYVVDSSPSTKYTIPYQQDLTSGQESTAVLTAVRKAIVQVIMFS
jgi:hypothetical protein